jgi:VanZ family protein
MKKILIQYYDKSVVRNVSRSILLVFVISLFWLGTKPEWVELFFIHPPMDKLLHLVVFGFIATLLWFSLLDSQPFRNFIFTAIIGVMDELHQYYIPGRTASFGDFSADLVGIAFSVWALDYARRNYLDPQMP